MQISYFHASYFKYSWKILNFITEQEILLYRIKKLFLLIASNFLADVLLISAYTKKFISWDNNGFNKSWSKPQMTLNGHNPLCMKPSGLRISWFSFLFLFSFLNGEYSRITGRSPELQVCVLYCRKTLLRKYNHYIICTVRSINVRTDFFM